MLSVNILYLSWRDWRVWAFTAIILLIGFYLFYRVTLLKTKYEHTPPIIFQFIGAVLMLPVLFLSKEPLPLISPSGNLQYLPLSMFLLSGLFYAIHDRAQATVRKHVDVAVSGVIDLSVHIFLILFGLIFLRENVTSQNVLGIVLIIIANFNIAYDFHKHKLNKYWPLGIIANLVYALGIIVDINLSSGRNLPFYLVLNYAWGASLILILTTVTSKLSFSEALKSIKTDFNKTNWFLHMATGFFSVYYTFAMLMAYRFGNISTITAVISTTVIYNTILAAIFLKERKMLLLKITSALIGVIGLILLIVDI